MTFLCLYSLKQGYKYMQTVAWIKHGTPVCCATVLRDGFLYTPHFPKKILHTLLLIIIHYLNLTKP